MNIRLSQIKKFGLDYYSVTVNGVEVCTCWSPEKAQTEYQRIKASYTKQFQEAA